MNKTIDQIAKMIARRVGARFCCLVLLQIGQDGQDDQSDDAEDSEEAPCRISSSSAFLFDHQTRFFTGLV